MMETARWIAGAILAVVALVVIVANWGYAIIYAATGKRGSAVPFIGGVLGALACLILPSPGTLRYWWLPLVVDVGCFGGVIAAIPVAIIKRLRR